MEQSKHFSADEHKLPAEMEQLMRTQPQANHSKPVQPSKIKFQLSDFHVLRTLGTGSFGRVHLVQRKQTGEYLAMKVMKKAEIVRLKQVDHTMNEKHILDAIDHPFLVNMLGSFQDVQNLYLILEYVSGGELFSLLRRSQVRPQFCSS